MIRAICFIASVSLLAHLPFCADAAEFENQEGLPELREGVRLPPIPSKGESWVPGLHYTVLVPPVKSQARTEKVEVIELFMYTSPLSRRVQPHVSKWLKTAPPYIEFVRKPSIVFPHARLQARMFITLQTLGRMDLHERLFDWIYDPNRYHIYHTIMTPDDAGYAALNALFAKENGISESSFVATYTSKEVSEKVAEAELETHVYHVRGTSTFVVNGKFSTSVQRIAYPKQWVEDSDFERLFRLIEYLAEFEKNQVKQ